MIELLVALAVIGLLATMAYPAYTQYVTRANRSSVQQFMLDISSAQEQYIQEARQYALDLSTLGFDTVPADVAVNYDIDIKPDTPATPPVYTIIAMPKTGSFMAGEATLKLNSAGVKLPHDQW